MEVTPILSRYEGVADCFNTILMEEGVSGLFKGFGAMLLQYTVHFLIIKFSSKIISQVASVFSSPPTLFSENQSVCTPSPVRLNPRLSKESITNSSTSPRQTPWHGGSSPDHQGPTQRKAFLNDIKEDVNNGAGHQRDI